MSESPLLKRHTVRHSREWLHCNDSLKVCEYVKSAPSGTVALWGHAELLYSTNEIATHSSPLLIFYQADKQAITLSTFNALGTLILKKQKNSIFSPLLNGRSFGVNRNG